MNFVFFMPDEMRAESVACYGHPVVRTPNLDRLAEEGTRFEQCHVQHTVCSPSRCSMMTGWYPHVSGHRTLWHLLRPHEPSLFRYLREAGYHIEWHGKNDLYAAESLPDCVDVYDSRPGPRAGGNPWPFEAPEYYSFLYSEVDCRPEDGSDMRNTAAGIEFLRNRSADDPPFVLYLPLGFPHPPYGIWPPYFDMYDPDSLPPLRTAETEGKPSFHAGVRETRRLGEVPDGVLRKIQAVYLGLTSYMDWVLGELLKALDETGLADDTAVFVFSDHGDWAGDFGLVEKWPSGLDDTLTRVPLLARLPGGAAGHEAPEPVELFDIMATTLELAGVEAWHTHFARSLVPQLHGEAGDPDRAVFAEGGYDPHEPHAFEGYPPRGSRFEDPRQIYYPKARLQQDRPDTVCRATMIRTMAHKLVRRTRDINELYDLREDPRELVNVYDDPAHAAARAELEDRMLDWHIRTADVVPFDENPRGLPERR